ncbi:hypothetical protein BKA70DRAFT_1440984 [Coprinopsis sp. MPI-PUGE-AT-0042]|nr:hypothetical protein BKA70DRAFT_1440984 [Coprinopsis sp. MPI-PUGE-AT-0042]
MDVGFTAMTKQRARESIDAQIISLENKVLQLKKQCNELAPVYTLPGELLSTIFRACIWDGQPVESRGRTLAAITWVSATWRAITLNDAFLWSTPLHMIDHQ